MALLDRFKKKEKKEKKPIKEGLVLDKKEDSPSNEAGKPKTVKKSVRKTPAGVYQIIREPHITEKATWLIDQNKYVFKVYPKANKVEVKKAIEALYRVKVEKVHIVHSAPKRRRLGRYQGWRGGLKKGFKKAIVTLKQGEKIELLAR